MKYWFSILWLVATVAVGFDGTIARSQEPPVPLPPADTPAATPVLPAEPDEPPAVDPPDPPQIPGVHFDLRFDGGREDGVQIGVSKHVRADETVPQVVVIHASATIDGTVTSDVVVIGGEAKINGRVEGDVVNVGAGIVVGPNGHIEGNAVGVLGGVQMESGASIDGDVVGIIGGVRRAQGSHIGGSIQNVSFADWTGVDGFSLPEWVKNTFSELVLKLRLLSFRVGWVWIAAGMFLGLYALLTVAAPGAIGSIVTTLSERPVTTFLMGLLVLPLAALCSLLLIATGVGLLVVPFLWAAVFFAGLVGKAGLLQFIGSAVSRGPKNDVAPLVALLIGAGLVSLLYWIPYLGLLFWMTFALWALGAAVLALFGRYRKEAPAGGAPVVPEASIPVPRPPTTPAGTAAATTAGGSLALAAAPLATSDSELKSLVPEATSPTASSVPPRSAPEPISVPDILTLPRVGFRERFLATIIDWVLLGMLMGWLDLDRLRPLVILAYFVGFWVWRQTTIGGLLLRLRVARVDGRPVDVATALVRALGALFGSLALGIGYFWAGWDPEKQGWHDKIAGTAIVKVPKTQPLV